MTTRAANGNVASMKIDDDIYIASSRISKISDNTFKNYKGDKNKLILSPSEKKLHPHTKDHPYKDTKASILENLTRSINSLNTFMTKY